MANRPGGRDRLESGAYAFGVWGSKPQPSAKSGRLTGRGAGDAWNAFGTHSRVGIVRSVFRHFRATESQPDRRPAPVRSGTAPRGVGIKTSAFRHFKRPTAITGSANKDMLVRSLRCKRGPCGARGSIPSTSHHANVAQMTEPGGGFDSRRSLQFVTGVRRAPATKSNSCERT